MAADYCTIGGYYYLITVDRFSNWPDIMQVLQNSRNSGAAGLIRALKRMFATFGVPRELSSDGGPEFIAGETQDFLRRWGVNHRLSSAYNPHSNGRAEVAVKSMKCLIQDNVKPDGQIDSESYVRAILQFRNTPDSQNGISPSEVVFGRQLRDVLPVKPRTQVFSDPGIRPVWKNIWRQREETLRNRSVRQTEALRAKTHRLMSFQLGDMCRIQNQSGRFATRWDKTGVIVQIGENDQYVVKVTGSGRLTLRNRKYLRKINQDESLCAPSVPYVSESSQEVDTEVRQDMGECSQEGEHHDCSEGGVPFQYQDYGEESLRVSPWNDVPRGEQVGSEVPHQNCDQVTPGDVQVESEERNAGVPGNEQVSVAPCEIVVSTRPIRAKVPRWHEQYEVGSIWSKGILSF